MTTATELAMMLAEVKLTIRQITGAYTGKHGGFDQGIQRAIAGLNKAIVESTEVVWDPAIPRMCKRRNEKIGAAAKRHANWMQRQEQVGLRNRIKGSSGAQ